MTDAAVVAAAAVGSMALVIGLERSTRQTFSEPLVQRENYAGRAVTTGVGTLIPIAAIIVAGVAALADAAEIDSVGAVTAGTFFTAALTAGFGLLGLLDDLLGAGQSGGFRGHLRELRRGQLTTGMLKWLGGAAFAVGMLSLANHGDLSRLLTDAAIVALAANLANLLDRRPARTTKFALVAMIPIAAAAGQIAFMAGPIVVVAAAIGLVPGELRERHMLGDAGANAIGAAVGWALVLVTTPVGRDVAALALLGLNLVSEVVSFSAVIERVPGLRHFDELGRRT